MIIETKYNPGDEVWAIIRGKPKMLSVISVHTWANTPTNANIAYKLDSSEDRYIEMDIYNTKDELLDYLKQWQ